MLYAMTGIHALSALPGCPGHAYDRRANLSDPHMSVSCPVHERHLAETKDPLWASSPVDVPLTALEAKRAEEADAERDKLAIKNSADSAAVLAQTAQLLAEISARLSPAPEAGAPAVTVPEAAAPAAGTVAPKAPRPRPKAPAGAGA